MLNKSQTAQKQIEEYIKEKKQIYDSLIQFLDNNESNEELFENLIDVISEQEQKEEGENKEKLEEFLQLILNISNNYHRDEFLFNKIFQIINYFEQQIKQTFSNPEIFNIFENNKKILHYLFKEEIITVDETILNVLLNKIDHNCYGYCHFFYPEIKKYKSSDIVNDIEKELLQFDSTIFDEFEKKREEGENDTFLCSLIRKDSVEKFIEYINRTNISVNSEITPSLFETNSFLIENKNTTLIEYAAFFGSIQIYKYLINNKAEIKPILWFYAIHSRNAELFHLLDDGNEEEEFEEEEKNIRFEKYLNYFCESIKCHHNEFAEYIQSNFLDEDKTRKNIKFLSSIFQSHNYAYFPSDFTYEDEFYYLSIYNYHKLVKLYMIKKEESIKKIVSKKIKIYIYL